jgi:L-amino acid N-acyltransferase YncA
MERVKFLPIKELDFVIVKEIYDHYIMHSTCTFHTEPISLHELEEYIFVNHPVYKSFLINFDNVVAGLCYFTYFKKRQAYERSVEVSIYLKPEFTNHGIGRRALEFMEDTARKTSIKNITAHITGNNNVCIKLFEKLGYTKCAHFKNIGEKMGIVLDVVAFQKEI